MAALAIARYCGARVVVHIMDDWHGALLAERTIRASLWRWYIHRKLQNLFTVAALRLAIGQGMADAYQQRFAHRFLAFQNCPDAGLWLRYRRRSWAVEGEFRFVFTGAVYASCNEQALLEMSRAVESIQAELPYSVHLDIYISEGQMAHVAETWEAFRMVHVHPLVADQETIARIYGEADALLLPFDFGETAMTLAQFSMPTKLPAFMLSGTPIFYCGPMEAAVAEYLLEHEAGYVATEASSRGSLRKHIMGFCMDAQLRQETAERALAVSMAELGSDTVRPRFQQELLEVIIS
jgi:glycosyltransferase involved in cell wall biosynthesis